MPPQASSRGRPAATSLKQAWVRASSLSSVSILSIRLRITRASASGRAEWASGSIFTPDWWITRPGIPTTVLLAATLRSSTEPAPMRVLAPTVIAPSTLAPAPTTTLSSRVGWRLPCTLPVPPRVTPW